MNLAYLRQQFIETSGRYDLLGEPVSDGRIDEAVKNEEIIPADFYINAGVRYLETHCTITALAETLINIPKGETVAILQSMRELRKVYIDNGIGGWQLLPEEAYEVVTIRHAPDIGLVDIKTLPLDKLIYMSVGRSASFRGVRLKQPVAGLYKFEGSFWLPALLKPVDTNYYAEQHPQLVLWAAMYVLEVSYRNNEGTKAWRASIQEELNYINNDHAREEATYTWHGDVI